MIGCVIALLSAPSNLGLRPPEPGATPGAAKAPEALREAGLFTRFIDEGAIDDGVVLPRRYRDDAEPGRLRNQDAIIEHSRRLADRICEVISGEHRPLVIGGDCSILTGVGLGLKRLGRFGLLHLDGHTDFRHPGNSAECASLAGEDLAAAIGLHWPEVADVDSLGPLFLPQDATHLGCREDDEHLAEVRSHMRATTVDELRGEGITAAATRIRDGVVSAELDGYWLHIDVDVLDPTHLPAVDSPAPGGLAPEELVELLRVLAPSACGADVTVFDPDLDPSGRYACRLAEIVHAGLADLGTRI
ncbi:arginase family protein [Saccharopolyspora sp. NPDC002686]|uniref:arginase family protein n=1 Tax=Saccharopolyspora sp. NPDC002686 TaxID=3154541 RepID=UPI00332B5FED